MTPLPTDPHPDPDQKVVDIASRTAEADHGHVGGLLVTVREMTLKQTGALVKTLLDNVDDTLFDLAEKAESNASQTEYFDGMRETRKKRPRIERLFADRVAREFADFAAGRPATPNEAQRAFSASGELSLVDDRELEESLAVSSMVAKAEGRLSGALTALNQRLSVLSGGRSTTNAGNPLGPNALTEAFREALGELAEVNIRVRLIILKMFERYVLKALDTLYHDVNVKLVQAGVLPQLHHPRVVRRHSAAAGSARGEAVDTAGAEAAVTAEAADYAAGATDDLHNELMLRLTSLLAARRQSAAPERAYTATGAPVASLTPAELLGALTLLQGESKPLPLQPVASDSVSTIDMVQHLKDELMAQIQRLSGAAHANVSGSDEDTIDLVGMLFEYILQDHTIPAPMQVLLARLQIPYLKVAILDRRMFAHTSHPARRLLDQLADAAKGWSEESDRDGRLFNKIKEIVESLLQDFDDDVGVFERKLAELAQFVEQNRKRAELAESRATEAARGRERLQNARRRAAQDILSRIHERNLPPLLRGVLTRPWANYLVLVLLRQGPESAEFRAGVHFVDDFVATAEVPHGDAAHRDYKAALPSIEKHLREGLATVAFQEPDIERLLDELRKFWRQQLGEPAPATQAAEPAADPEAVLGVTQDAQPAITDTVPELDDDFDPDDMSVNVDSGSLQAVRDLKVGDWVEFTDEAGTRERAKLSWISPISGKYLFVNRRGLKVADRTAVQLATELHNERAMILEEVPLFDRALDAIVDRLRNAQPSTTPRAGA
ncbi:MAG: DUF1631 domain-containing protein [Rhodanobacteraceae bacterium]|nr:MAG: DUF1631 domain-containing protein [Rhodanobacteraceae bacterium]